MIGFGKNKSNDQKNEEIVSKKGFFSRLKNGLKKTRANFTDSLADFLATSKEIDEDLLEELETLLLTTDMGVEATEKILNEVKQRLKVKQLRNPAALIQALSEDMQEMLLPCNLPLQIDSSKTPFVILMVGVNGVGKTTTIGKLAQRFKQQGKSVMLAAGDTFRAAAVEQLQVWGQRNDIPVIAHHAGADSAAVLFDALQAARARKVDVLIADTAGRLHTQVNLMEELKKIKRVLTKVDAEAPHEVMLVLDAGTGQNALSQAKQFREAVNVTGITLTKLDGTAKGGIVFAIAKQLGLPIRFIGVGENIEDLREFNAEDFVRALLSQEDEE